MCNCTEQCSCGSSVIPSGPQGPMGSPGSAGINGITNIYSSSAVISNNSITGSYVSLAGYSLPANTLSTPVSNTADALDITIPMSHNFNNWNYPQPLNAISVNIFNNNIYLQNFGYFGEILIKARVSVISSNSAKVSLIASGYPISNGSIIIKNVILTSLNFNIANPIEVLINQSQVNAFTLKGIYIDKIKGA